MSWDWNTVLTATQLEAYYAELARRDALYARSTRDFWETRLIGELRTLVWGAWAANDRTSYVLARSYIDLFERKPENGIAR